LISLTCLSALCCSIMKRRPTALVKASSALGLIGPTGSGKKPVLTAVGRQDEILPFSKKAVLEDLDKSAKILIGGIFAGLVAYGAGDMNRVRLERRVEELHAACVAEREAEAAKQGALSALASILSRKMTCDPVELAQSEEYPGTRGQLAAAERNVLGWNRWPPILAMAIALLCSLPWLWYFFLRRIRELREALFGK